MAAIALKLFSPFLERYFDGFQPQRDFNHSFFKGKTTIRNLRVKQAAVNEVLQLHCIPLELTEGSLSEIHISMNVTKLSKEPVSIHIESLHLSFKEREGGGRYIPAPKSSFGRQHNNNNGLNTSGSSTNSPQQQQKGKKKYSKMQKMLDGLQIEIDELYISFEFLRSSSSSSSSSDPLHHHPPPHIYLLVQEMSLFSVDENWNATNLPATRSFSKNLESDVFSFKRGQGMVSCGLLGESGKRDVPVITPSQINLDVIVKKKSSTTAPSPSPSSSPSPTPIGAEENSVVAAEMTFTLTSLTMSLTDVEIKRSLAAVEALRTFFMRVPSESDEREMTTLIGLVIHTFSFSLNFTSSSSMMIKDGDSSTKSDSNNDNNDNGNERDGGICFEASMLHLSLITTSHNQLDRLWVSVSSFSLVLLPLDELLLSSLFSLKPSRRLRQLKKDIEWRTQLRKSPLTNHDEAVVKEGWLHLNVGTAAQWDPCYVRLTSHRLCWSETEVDGEMDSIPLEHYIFLRGLGSGVKKSPTFSYVFRLVLPRNCPSAEVAADFPKSLVFAASDDVDLQEWEDEMSTVVSVPERTDYVDDPERKEFPIYTIHPLEQFHSTNSLGTHSAISLMWRCQPASIHMRDLDAELVFHVAPQRLVVTEAFVLILPRLTDLIHKVPNHSNSINNNSGNSNRPSILALKVSAHVGGSWIMVSPRAVSRSATYFIGFDQFRLNLGMDRAIVSSPSPRDDSSSSGNRNVRRLQKQREEHFKSRIEVSNAAIITAGTHLGDVELSTLISIAQGNASTNPPAPTSDDHPASPPQTFTFMRASHFLLEGSCVLCSDILPSRSDRSIQSYGSRSAIDAHLTVVARKLNCTIRDEHSRNIKRGMEAILKMTGGEKGNHSMGSRSNSSKSLLPLSRQESRDRLEKGRSPLHRGNSSSGGLNSRSSATLFDRAIFPTDSFFLKLQVSVQVPDMEFIFIHSAGETASATTAATPPLLCLKLSAWSCEFERPYSIDLEQQTAKRKDALPRKTAFFLFEMGNAQLSIGGRVVLCPHIGWNGRTVLAPSPKSSRISSSEDGNFPHHNHNSSSSSPSPVCARLRLYLVQGSNTSSKDEKDADTSSLTGEFGGLALKVDRESLNAIGNEITTATAAPNTGEKTPRLKRRESRSSMHRSGSSEGVGTTTTKASLLTTLFSSLPDVVSLKLHGCTVALLDTQAEQKHGIANEGEKGGKMLYFVADDSELSVSRNHSHLHESTSSTTNPTLPGFDIKLSRIQPMIGVLSAKSGHSGRVDDDDPENGSAARGLRIDLMLCLGAGGGTSAVSFALSQVQDDRKNGEKAAASSSSSATSLMDSVRNFLGQGWATLGGGGSVADDHSSSHRTTTAATGTAQNGGKTKSKEECESVGWKDEGKAATKKPSIVVEKHSIACQTDDNPTSLLPSEDRVTNILFELSKHINSSRNDLSKTIRELTTSPSPEQTPLSSSQQQQWWLNGTKGEIAYLVRRMRRKGTGVSAHICITTTGTKRKCFFGCEAVTWVIASLGLGSRDIGTDLCQRMLDDELIVPIVQDEQALQQFHEFLKQQHQEEQAKGTSNLPLILPRYLPYHDDDTPYTFTPQPTNHNNNAAADNKRRTSNNNKENAHNVDRMILLERLRGQLRMVEDTLMHLTGQGGGEE